MSVPTFQVQGLCKTFCMGATNIYVLRDLDFQVAPGEMVAVVGASGSGKTTFLHALGALDTPTSGQVLFQGIDLYAMSPARRTRLRARHIGFVFQAYHLLPELDAFDNVLLPSRSSNSVFSRMFDEPRSAGKTTAAASASPAGRASALLDSVGLAGRAEHLPGELSGGEQQRVALARALINDPDVVLADEPTGNLDLETGRHVLESLFDLVRSGHKTLIFVTHNMEIARQADRILELRNGRLAPAAL